MAKPEKPVTIDDELRKRYRNFKMKSLANKAFTAFTAACTFVPGFREKSIAAAIELAKIGGNGAMVATEFAANHVPLPDKFPSRPGTSPIKIPVSMATMHITSDVSNYSRVYGQGATGPGVYPSLKVEAVGYIEVGPKPARKVIEATLEGGLA